jgi:hypothetical protein
MIHPEGMIQTRKGSGIFPTGKFPPESVFLRRENLSRWEEFCQAVTPGKNRLLIGWFGVEMAIAIKRIKSAIAVNAAYLNEWVDPGFSFALNGNHLITTAVVPTAAGIGLHLDPIGLTEAADRLLEWLLPGDKVLPTQLRGNAFRNCFALFAKRSSYLTHLSLVIRR